MLDFIRILESGQFSGKEKAILTTGNTFEYLREFRAAACEDKAALFRKYRFLDRDIFIGVLNPDNQVDVVRELTNAEKLGLLYPELLTVSNIYAVDFDRA